MFSRILREGLSFGKAKLSAELKDMLGMMLEKDPTRRIQRNQAWMLKQHEWCRGVDWDRVYLRKVSPPYVPSVDESHFDA